jgi:transcription antitermination factor NusG
MRPALLKSSNIESVTSCEPSSSAAYKAGDRLRVAKGPFTGAEGTVRQVCSGGRLILLLDLLQAGVSLEIDQRSLEPLN